MKQEVPESVNIPLPPNDVSTIRLQKFYEFVVPSIGFAASFAWDGPLALKVILMLILFRLCFLWGETLSLQRQMQGLYFHLLIEQGKANALVWGIHSNLVKSGVYQSDTEVDPEEQKRIIEEMENFDSTFEESFIESFEGTKQINQLLTFTGYGGLGDFFFALTGITFTVAVTALIGWLLSTLFSGLL